MEFKNVIEYLINNKYISMHNGKYKFTSLFYKELTGVEKGLTLKGNVEEPNLLPVVQTTELEVNKLTIYTQAQWVKFYMDFLKASDIPDRCNSTDGTTYALNKYSEEGMKVFQKAIKEGYNLQILISTVKLYYKSNIRLKKAIGRYMKDGDWRTDYEALKIHIEAGSVVELIKQETADERATNYTIG